MFCINVKHLSKSYGSIPAVDDLMLSVESGQVFGFLGPNGAGKSTTIKLLTTLIPPSSGSLSILGIDAIANPLQIRHKIGVVLQQPSYEPTLSVEKSLDKYGMMWNVPKTERKKRTKQLLKDFDLLEIRKKRNEDLSIGQRRRVQVAREFMHDMELLFLDEPTVGLDPSARRKLLDYLKTKVKTGLTIFYTTHILSEAEYLCDQVAIIDKGKIITVDSPDALKNRFGKEKTIKIHLLEKQSEILSLLTGIPDCKINFESGTNIIIHSEQSELVLLQILKILNDNNIEIEDLSAVPTSLEEIFLKMMKENASDN
ncbi:ABC transporter, ATP-binding protein [Candidatus Nitrosopumilus salaria BD31]|uniref:ABC transporter, ATP-binding protein n=1 Tax=Candidatus Nitrosopumilus salarius BD31 TaxID=859350 RepID=I3D1W4_9ARCH|nr:ABC transporter ATP-binding protein [Candidatus Nitrosopumilus salaria]EIJ65707.1 ABC transporter, ATP-binding protein [Candidatus Nitrosopumilus salaria BD31]